MFSNYNPSPKDYVFLNQKNKRNLVQNYLEIKKYLVSILISPELSIHPLISGHPILFLAIVWCSFGNDLAQWFVSEKNRITLIYNNPIMILHIKKRWSLTGNLDFAFINLRTDKQVRQGDKHCAINISVWRMSCQRASQDTQRANVCAQKSMHWWKQACMKYTCTHIYMCAHKHTDTYKTHAA